MASIGAALGHSFGGSATLSPLSIDSGLVLWLKADSITGKNDGDTIGTGDWADSSGNSNNPTQGTANLKPLYKTGIINSLPVVRFDGSNDYLVVTRNSGLEPNNVTIFMVARAAAAPQNSAYLLSKKHSTGSTASYAIQRSNATTAIRTICRVATTGSVTPSPTIADATVWDGNGHLALGRVDGTTGGGSVSQHHLGQFYGCATAAGNLAYDSNNLVIGNYDEAVTSLYAAFDLAELLIYNTALSWKKIGQVSHYLGQKYSIAT